MTKRAFAVTAFATFLMVFAGLQFVRRPTFRNPPVSPSRALQTHVQVPADVDTILRRSCYDCHSNETQWPSYARVSPVSWLVARDVRHGQADLNFSEWSTDPAIEPTPAQRLGGICSDLRKGIMPLRSYRVMHPRARLSALQVERVCAWTQAARVQLPIDEDRLN